MDAHPARTPSPWITMLYRPRATIRGIVAADPYRTMPVLVILSGLVMCLARAADQHQGDEWEVPLVLARCALIGPVVNGVWFLLGGILVKWTGSWLGGQASGGAIRAAMAWSTVPVIDGLALWVGMIRLVGRELFTTEKPTLTADGMLASLYGGFVILFLGLEIWMLSLFVLSLSEVQRFSVWKALGNVVLAGLVLLVPLLGVLVLLSRA